MNKIKVEKSLYQPNTLGYNLILLSIALNGYYLIRILNIVEKNYDIGGIVLFNIFVSLLLFLGAVRCKVYNQRWAIGIIVIGAIQAIRPFVSLPEEVVELKTQLILVVVVSGLVLISAGIISLIKVLNQKELKRLKQTSEKTSK